MNDVRHINPSKDWTYLLVGKKWTLMSCELEVLGFQFILPVFRAGQATFLHEAFLEAAVGRFGTVIVLRIHGTQSRFRRAETYVFDGNTFRPQLANIWLSVPFRGGNLCAGRPIGAVASVTTTAFQDRDITCLRKARSLPMPLLRHVIRATYVAATCKPMKNNLLRIDD